MRINKYSLELDENRLPILVKQASNNYPELDKCSNPGNIAKMLRVAFHADTLAEEHLWVIALDTKLNIKEVFEVSHSTYAFTVSNQKGMFTRLLLSGANSFVIAHILPSGEPTPSKEDYEMTENCKQIGRILEIEMIDHIIVAGNEYVSLREKMGEQWNK